MTAALDPWWTGTGPSAPWLRTRHGRRELPVQRWTGSATAEERAVLARATGPVLDVGCGPGRHAAALAGRGVDVLGLDISLRAVTAARGRGAPAVTGCVFGPVPRAGEWRTALLLDGNVGIGGDPVRLLARISELLARPGAVLVEVAGPGRATRTTWASVEHDGSPAGMWFPWAEVGVDRLADIAAAAGFLVRSAWSGGDRWFARLTTP